MSPRVSIAIPAYNGAAYLAPTLESALAQTYDDYEVVIADHSSTDGTAEVIERYRGESRLRVLDPTPAGGGAKRNWDRVSAEAHGELLKLLPGDDLIDPTLLERQVKGFDANPGVDLSCTNRTMVDAHGTVFMANRGLPRGMAGVVPGADVIRACVRAGTNVMGEPGAVLLRRSLLEQVGWWDDAQPYHIDQRTYTNVLLAGMAQGHGQVWAVAEPLASFRVNAGQWSVRLAGEQAAMAAALHGDLHREHPEVVSAGDVRLGNLKARVNAVGRQVVYRLLGSRMG